MELQLCLLQPIQASTAQCKQTLVLLLQFLFCVGSVNHHCGVHCLNRRVLDGHLVQFIPETSSMLGHQLFKVEVLLENGRGQQKRGREGEEGMRPFLGADFFIEGC